MPEESLTAEYDRFRAPADFAYFARCISLSKDFEEVPVGQPYSNVGHTEGWYRHLPTQKVYRLVEPDGPFQGLWEIAKQAKRTTKKRK